MIRIITIKLNLAEWELVQKIMGKEDFKTVAQAVRFCINQTIDKYSEGLHYCFGRWVTESEWQAAILARAEQDPTWIVKENGFADIDHNDKIIAKVKKLARESQ